MARPKHKRETHDIFDQTIKYLLFGTSPVNIIYLINSLFGKRFSRNSPVTFGKTESVTKRGKGLELFRSDIIINIGKATFAIEFQIGNDNTIGLRLFEYSFRHAHDKKEIRNKGEVIEISIPDACVVYFESTKNTPEHVTFRLKNASGTQSFDYKVRVFKMAEQSLEDIERKKLLLLLPFCLIRYRKELESKKLTPERLKGIAEAERKMISDLEEILARSRDNKIISNEDCIIILESIAQMHEELYQGYNEFKEALMALKSEIHLNWLPYKQKLLDEIAAKEAERIKVLAEKDKALAEKEAERVKALEEKDKATDEIINIFKEEFSEEEVERILAKWKRK